MKSWNGIENKKDLLIGAAKLYYEKDDKLGILCSEYYLDAVTLTSYMLKYRDRFEFSDDLLPIYASAMEAVDALKALQKLKKELIFVDQLDWKIVENIVGPILEGKA
jgi:hypothetical protein